MNGILVVEARAARRRREPMGYWPFIWRRRRSDRGVCTRSGLGLGGLVDDGGGGGCDEVVEVSVVVANVRIGRFRW